jgi:hypothetical protein
LEKRGREVLFFTILGGGVAWGAIHRGWARSASGNTTEGILWIEQGIRDFRATGGLPYLPYFLPLKTEAFHLADRTSEALEAINEAEALAKRFNHRSVLSGMHRLRGVFLAALGADEMQIEASFCEAVRTAREQKSISLEKRAEGTYAEYRRQKASASEGRGFRLPLWWLLAARCLSVWLWEVQRYQTNARDAKRGHFGYKRSAKGGVLSQGCLGELVIKGLRQIDATR